MAEIKSTIDLVMERTRNLTMTEEERKAARTSEALGKARGWIQRYLDDVIDMQRLMANATAEEKDVPEFREILKAELRNFLKLEADNGKVLRLFQELLGISTDPIEELIETFRREMQKEGEKRAEQIRRELADRKISGTAIVPNPARNESWTAYLRTVEERFRESARTLTLG